jgi:hypothetical protein
MPRRRVLKQCVHLQSSSTKPSKSPIVRIDWHEASSSAPPIQGFGVNRLIRDSSDAGGLSVAKG